MGKKITGHTRMMAVLGSPVFHSFSPMMHNEAFQELGLDFVYLAFQVEKEQLEDALNSLKLLNFAGANLTMPLKQEAIKFCDQLSEAARISGSVNTIVNDHGILIGHTTDGTGFLWAMKENGCDIIGKKVVMMGAGGAATSIVVQAALDGVREITVFNRKGTSYDKMCKIAEELNKTTSCCVKVLTGEDREQLREEIKKSQVVINGTSLGMAPNIHASILPDASYFHSELTAVDVIYNPHETLFMKQAKEAGAKAFNGLYMLLYQGAAAFQLWTKQEMPVEQVKQKVFDPEMKKNS